MTIDRSAISRALAKSLAYVNCGNRDKARRWGLRARPAASRRNRRPEGRHPSATRHQPRTIDAARWLVIEL
jgi:hypothetical protein